MTDKQIEHEMLMQLIQEDCYVDPKKKLEYPPVALSFGEKLLKSKKGDTLLPIGITYGNISTVTAPPKTKKTFFVS